jgi:hypothetical protein
LSCRGGPDEQPGFFGSTPLKFEDNVGFVDFLYSLTDNSFVPRGGEFPDTRLFLDGLTTVLEGLLVFFNPAYGVTTLMRITAEDPTGTCAAAACSPRANRAVGPRSWLASGLDTDVRSTPQACRWRWTCRSAIW